ncbi:MAG TPA: NmrA family NAD(P)-binding protein, partial [Solirubrobacteraceae bacterium]|nr:NmrA family NAD(P)-binding protein [Solirubrobacteraceae bacterium]
ERRHGLALADALGEAQIDHLVYVSGAGADRPTGVPVFESKRAVEQRIAEVGLTATILAPVYFMENAFNPWNLTALARGGFPLPLPADRTLAQVAIDDVAEAAVSALERPGEFAGRRMELASDALTGAQAAERLSRVTGRAYAFERLSLDALAPPLRPLFEWLDEVGFDGVDVSGRSFERWAAAQRWPG